ncbi:tail protein X [Rappaport israeli]|uniref:tail protein X n=1 Tax=Rappaport israeli TaxID=1839807 RepID=UPI0009316A3A|nr:tail protein X [Rappaport israeli]
MIVITQQHDTLDALCYRTTGRTDIIGTVIEDNPHAIHPPILPAGLRISVPDLPKAPPRKPSIKLWD